MKEAWLNIKYMPPYIGLTVLMAIMVAMGLLVMPTLLRFMREHRLTAPNYAEIPIPTGLGCLVWLIHIVQLMLVGSFGAVLGISGGSQAAYSSYFGAIAIVFVVGWLDDTVGDRTVKGWKGHWREWRVNQTLTTGLLKAAGTGCAASIAVTAVGPASIWIGLLQVMLVLLMTNAFNLLDLRPGRSIKMFIILCTAIAFLMPEERSLLLLLPSVVAAFVLLPGDLKARHMLGDAGANMLGFAAGIGLIGSTPIWLQAIMAVILLGLHHYAERRSISAWIEAHRLFSWLDRWGRV